MLFDPSKSRKSEKGMLQELPFRDRKIEPIVKDRLVDGVWPVSYTHLDVYKRQSQSVSGKW